MGKRRAPKQEAGEAQAVVTPPAITPNIKVSAVMFAAATICVSREETRYYLGGVYIHPHPEKGALLVATDGHRLVVIHDEAGACATPAIVKADKEALHSLTRVKEDDALLVDSAGIVAIPGFYVGAKPAVIDGTFPDYARVIRPVLANVRKKLSAPASFNPDYITDFGRLGTRLNKNSHPIRIVTFDESSAALILWPTIGNAFGLLMPMKTNNLSALPAFIRPVLSPAKAPVAAKPPAKKKLAARLAKPMKKAA
jgi:hypothetical protein